MRVLAMFLMALAIGLTGPAVAADKGAEKGSQKAAALIDINSASAEQLQTLDGIGDARAKAIIKGRLYNGKNELVDKKIIPEGVYEKIKDRIIAHQSKKK
ncbi:MAG: helix-hairpin-helix domain-containing protein [Betaproteobacteria bacterium]|nr:helix-hairpin-helix domain-containing protein [Betaproteobacteria bacterium]